MRSRGTFDLTAATRVPGADFAGKLSGNATVAVSPSQYYVLVLANTGASAPTDVLYQFATYSSASPGVPLAWRCKPVPCWPTPECAAR